MRPIPNTEGGSGFLTGTRPASEPISSLWLCVQGGAADPEAPLVALLVSTPVRASRCLRTGWWCCGHFTPLYRLPQAPSVSLLSLSCLFFKIIVLFSLLNSSLLPDRNTRGGYSSARTLSLGSTSLPLRCTQAAPAPLGFASLPVLTVFPKF